LTSYADVAVPLGDIPVGTFGIEPKFIFIAVCAKDMYKAP
jgi:hypothetical protein